MSIALDTELLPSFFVPELQQNYPDDVQRILDGYEARRASTLRANTRKATAEEVQAALTEMGLPPTAVAWYPDAFILPGGIEGDLWKQPFFEEGKVYLQSLSSMMPPFAVKAHAGSDILDMCAAPGGKTTQMAALYPQANITACEINAIRADKLEYNLKKQGATNVLVMREDARKLDSFFSFAYILLDAPCSGSGTLRIRDPKLKKFFHEKLVAQSVKQQKALLSKALEMLKPGGRLVYSTCSVLKRENEEVVRDCLAKAAKKGNYYIQEHALDMFLENEDIPKLPSTIEGALTVCPTELFEGFFMVCIGRR